MNLPAPAASGPAEVFALHKIDNPVLHEPGARKKEQGRTNIDGVNLPAPAASGPAEVFAWHEIDNPVLHERGERRKEQGRNAVGDVVIICEAIVPRERWRVARIMEITSQDATHHRRFKLRDSAGNVFDRDQSGVVKLEL